MHHPTAVSSHVPASAPKPRAFVRPVVKPVPAPRPVRHTDRRW
ncbi:MAG: hypothetical protein QOH46_3969 [Solirubrobacteraceae bacterium]|jgi:hypothetical protein|nr:hypothetical protein [Solirubrobacteraceae bacterium]